MKHTCGLILLLCACATTSASHDEGSSGLTFIEDDYPKALSAAKERSVPLFIDASAPWCHSCVFLKQHVLNAPALAHNDARYVFLSIDTEKEKNAPFLDKFPVEVWPTLFIVEPKSEKAVLKWLGTGTVAELEKLLDDGEIAARTQDGADPVALLAKADQLYASGNTADSATAYRAAFDAMPKDHPRRARGLESLINALYASRQLKECAQLAVAEAPALPRGPAFVNTVSLGLACASETHEGIEVLEPLAVESLTLEGILADDTSGIYEDLVALKEERKDAGGAKALALQWLAFLEAQAAKASTPAARAVFDPHRVSAALAAKEPLRAEQALLQTAKDFPDDYNPLARLAVIYRELGRYDDALKAIDAGLTKAYGPRKLRLFETKASILAKKGDIAGQKATLAQAVAYGRALPASQRPQKSIERLEADASKLP